MIRTQDGVTVEILQNDVFFCGKQWFYVDCSGCAEETIQTFICAHVTDERECVLGAA